MISIINIQTHISIDYLLYMIFQHIIYPMKSYRISILLAVAAILFLTSCSAPSSAPDQSADNVTLIENKGSDTIVNLALAWAEEYQGINPRINLSVTGGGSGTGIAALINGTVDIANASRRIKEEENRISDREWIHPG